MIEHKHLIIRAHVNSPPTKGGMGTLSLWFKDLIASLGMKLLSGPHIRYVDMPGNKGITAVCIIETSHIAMHVWDEQSPALMQLDVYSCGPLDPQIVFSALDGFEPASLQFKFLDREHGLQELPTS